MGQQGVRLAWEKKICALSNVNQFLPCFWPRLRVCPKTYSCQPLSFWTITINKSVML